MTEIEERIRARQSDDEETIRRRLETARSEMERAGEFEYILINETGKLDATVERLTKILDAERLKADAPPSL